MSLFIACFSLLLFSLSDFALGAGLGDARVLSRLGQPLRVEVALHHEGPPDGMVATVANSATYSSVGLDKNNGLLGATVRMVTKGRQSFAVIETTSAYEDLTVSLLLELRMPSGTLRRHFELLIDPSDGSAQGPMEPSDRGGASTLPVQASGIDEAPAKASGEDQRQSGRPPTARTNSAAAGRPARETSEATLRPQRRAVRASPEATIAAPRRTQQQAEGLRASEARLLRLIAEISEAEGQLEQVRGNIVQASLVVNGLERERERYKVELARLDREARDRQEREPPVQAARAVPGWGLVVPALASGLLAGVLGTILFRAGQDYRQQAVLAKTAATNPPRNTTPGGADVLDFSSAPSLRPPAGVHSRARKRGARGRHSKR